MVEFQAEAGLHVLATCGLEIHDGTFSSKDVIVNESLLSSWNVKVGERLSIHAIGGHIHNGASDGSRTGGLLMKERSRPRLARPSYVFTTELPPPEILAKYPSIGISVSQSIAVAVGFTHRCLVTVSKVDADSYLATHVELAFRDAYMTRSDMWRFVVTELARYRSIYKGQRILFLGHVKICVKTIYRHGKKISSAFFGPGTKPIFRSESARYILYIQMSSEMWEFDPEGSGEIMFTKVVDGFLPELFKRWQELGVRHSLTIILFTRMQYDVREDRPPLKYTTTLEFPQSSAYRDFYHTIANEVAPDHLAIVLSKLKREFKSYLRNVSTVVAPKSHLNASTEIQRRTNMNSKMLVAGRPSPAAQGNILEAIDLAASQFSEDRVDRDITRTGLSVVVVTPGPGIFEVDSKMLGQVTDHLIEDNIGIDLVCLARMPLHSVPLFKYRNAAVAPLHTIKAETADARGQDYQGTTEVEHSIDNLNSPGLLTAHQKCGPMYSSSWSYSIPQWIDVSFWRTEDTSFNKQNASALDEFPSSLSRSFIPRVRMYEVQMMGIMENEIQSVTIKDIKSPNPTISRSDKIVKNDGPGLQKAQPVADRLDGLSLPQTTSMVQPSSFLPILLRPSIQEKPQESMQFWMDGYEETLFTMPDTLNKQSLARTRESGISNYHTHAHVTEDNAHHQSLDFTSQNVLTERKPSDSLQDHTPQPEKLIRPVRKKSSTGSSFKSFLAISKPGHTPHPHKLAFAGASGSFLKAMPVIEVSSEVAHRQGPQGRELEQVSSTLSNEQYERQEGQLKDAVALASYVSKTSTSKRRILGASSHHPRPVAVEPQNETSKSPREDSVESQKSTLIESGMIGPNPSGSVLEIVGEKNTSNESGSTMAWLVIPNPTNPSKTPTDPSKRLGKWRHVFPKPLHASHIKWKSLCSPASIPLTTETFQTFDQFKANKPNNIYKTTGTIPSETKSSEPDFWLIRDMIAARLSQGFQIVARLPNPGCHDTYQDEDCFIQVGTTITMCKGLLIHCLAALDGSSVETRLYSPLSQSRNVVHDGSSCRYAFNNRTILDSKYGLCSTNLSRPRRTFDWLSIDSFLARQYEHSSDLYPENLDCWEARFALIPLRDLYISGTLDGVHEEDNEEEIRLEGIYRLTQLWQDNKHAIPGTNKLQSTRRKTGDNPLDIIFRTQSVSSVVTTELHEALLGNGINEESPPDLSEDELFDKSNYDLTHLAKVLQSERGVRLRDRRWHWRLHYNCFIGLELVTWLMENCRNVEDRGEAVDLGNQLMQDGLFTHVEKRHDFRDGNYFYQISHEHRYPKTDARNSWLHRLSSIPSTPVAEPSKDNTTSSSMKSPLVEYLEDDTASKAVRANQPKVSLSKKLLYNVDRRKKFRKQEVFNLHYDRVSSADDCYHFRIDWFTTTPKLVEEALSTWINTAERHGLRLVQLPIREASKLGEIHPFHSAYTIQIQRKPLETRNIEFSNVTSIRPKPVTEHAFQRAILKKFDFVLDMEAVTDFPASVDISYSWGRPVYQYAQYVSRNGVLLAQVTERGDILVVPNNVARTRGLSPKTSKLQQGNAAVKASTCDIRQFPGMTHSSELSNPVSVSSTSKVNFRDHLEEVELARYMKDEIETFCSDPEALARFYEEWQRKMLLDNPRTPILPSVTSQDDPPSTLMLAT